MASIFFNPFGLVWFIYKAAITCFASNKTTKLRNIYKYILRNLPLFCLSWFLKFNINCIWSVITGFIPPHFQQWFGVLLRLFPFRSFCPLYLLSNLLPVLRHRPRWAAVSSYTDYILLFDIKMFLICLRQKFIDRNTLGEAKHKLRLMA